ncbi:MAG: SGNH/GDSL hydrolase family protein [Sporolactobacillus sp.]
MVHLVCFGDSLTAGWDGQKETPRLTCRLEKGLGLPVRNAGVPGETTRQALKRLVPDVLNQRAPFVTVLFGSNDASFHKGIPIDEFTDNLRKICRTINDTHLLLLTPPPVIESRQIGKRINARIDHYVSAIEAVARALPVDLADFHQLMLEQRDYTTCLLPDGLHLTDSGYDLLAGLIISHLTPFISTNKNRETFKDKRC